MTVLITRPLNQSISLQHKLNEIGLESLIFPTMTIEPVVNSSSFLAGINALSKSQVIIFTSANAVHFTMPYWPRSAVKNLQIAAIGPATAKALEDFNINVTYIAPPPYTSEALLTLPIFKQVENKLVIIFKGENGRLFLSETLQQRHAKVIVAASYRRVAVKSLPEVVKKNWRKITIIIITSGESLTHLMHFFVDDPNNVLQKTLLVPSQRILTLAKRLGFKKILLAGNPTDDAILNTIKTYL